jgi:leader peptidase (prepilin peptidase) / N-methyltransferase
VWWLTAVVGSLTAFSSLRAETIAGAALAVVVAGLLIVQTPMDLRMQHLSRRVTVIAIALVSAVIAVDVVAGVAGVRSAVVTVGSAAVVVAAYAFLHRLSPRSLGWGDVLLVAPLGLAIGYVAADRVVVWQLLASTTGAIHALMLRQLRGVSTIPFGPHLLVAAWLVLLASV